MTDNSAETELLALAERFPEINPNNYNEDDVIALNNWGCEVFDALRSTAATVSRDREAIAECIWRAEFRRGASRERLVPWSEVAEVDRERYRYIADAILSLTPIGSGAEAMRAYRALFEPEESDAYDNLQGALIDIKRLSVEGKPTDEVCIRTIARVLDQLAAAYTSLAALPLPVPGKQSSDGYYGCSLPAGACHCSQPSRSKCQHSHWKPSESLSPVLVQLVQTRCEQPVLSGNDGSEAKSGDGPTHTCKRAGGFVDSNCMAMCDCHETMKIKAPTAGGNNMTEDQIKYLVNRFLGWRLPENFNPDGGVSFKKTHGEGTPYPGKYEPYGTNLLDATQADAMVRHMIDGMPLPAAPASLTEGDVA